MAFWKGGCYLDEVSEEQRATFLRMLETQEMSDLRKIDVNNTAGPASQEEKTKLKDERPDYSAADEEKDKGIFKLLFDALEKRQAVHGSREELDAMMAAVSAGNKSPQGTWRNQDPRARNPRNGQVHRSHFRISGI